MVVGDWVAWMHVPLLQVIWMVSAMMALEMVMTLLLMVMKLLRVMLGEEEQVWIFAVELLVRAVDLVDQVVGWMAIWRICFCDHPEVVWRMGDCSALVIVCQKNVCKGKWREVSSSCFVLISSIFGFAYIEDWRCLRFYSELTS